MNLKKSLLIALFSFGIAQSALAETDSEKFDRAVQLTEQENYYSAFPLYKQLAEQGIAEAQFNLGNMYNNSKGVAQDYKQAIYWYTKAAGQGIADAQFNLGYVYYNGKGVDQDYKQAIYWYTKAAEQGDAQAQMMLGLNYLLGEIVRLDKSKAKYYFGLAQDIYPVFSIFSARGSKHHPHASIFTDFMRHNPILVNQDDGFYFHL